MGQKPSSTTPPTQAQLEAAYDEQEKLGTWTHNPDIPTDVHTHPTDPYYFTPENPPQTEAEFDAAEKAGTWVHQGLFSSDAPYNPKDVHTHPTDPYYQWQIPGFVPTLYALTDPPPDPTDGSSWWS